MSTNRSLLTTNITALEEGADLLTILGAEQYTAGYKPAFHSTIGAHFRHVLEHYRCLLTQLETGSFCYDNRERDQLLECEIDYAARTIAELTVALSNISDSDFERLYSICDEQAAGPVETTLQRELLFLQSHTMHHYAIIGAMSRAFGKQPDDDFGVAIATRTHQQKCAEQAGVTEKATVSDEVSPCAQ